MTASGSLHLSHVGIQVADPASIARFYESALGLAHAEMLADGAVRLGWGRGHHALELRAGAGLDHFGLEVSDDGHMETIAQRLDAIGVPVREGRLPANGGATLRFEDPDRNVIELHGPVDRSGERVADVGRRPVRIHHVTLASRSVTALSDFYVEALGFRVSDRMGDRFQWLRCNQEHHTVAVVEADELGLDHYAFELDSWAAFKTWCDDLAVLDVPLTWGPGRHGPGNNLFIMFDDPAGYRIELCAEMERYWDDAAEYAPRIWEPSAKTVNLWGPAAAWRAPVTDGVATER